MQEYAPEIFEAYIPSKSGIKKAIKKGRILANDKVAETGTWVYEGQVLKLIENVSKLPKIYEFKLDIVYEDNFCAVIIKPAGISVSGNKFKTIVNALPFNLQKSEELDALETPTPVHRLDNQTSGLLLIAKTKTAQIELGKQFESNTIQKKYCTIVTGKVHQNRTITTPINTKNAETKFEIIKVVKSLKFKELSCLQVYPKTGRTHQIRIHLASIGHPILGDKLYGSPQQNASGKGLFLCASQLKFLHPKTFEARTVSIEVPHKFNALLNREKRRWNTFHI